MNARTYSTRGMIGILALLSAMIVFSIVIAPAKADSLVGQLGYGNDDRAHLIDADAMRDLLPVLDVIIPGAEEAAEGEDFLVPPDEGPFPDGGDWEMVPRPEEGPFPDGGDWEMVPRPEDAGEDDAVPDEPATDEDADEADEPAAEDAGGDDAVSEEPAVDETTGDGAEEAGVPEEQADQTADQQQPEQPQPQSDETSTLAYTGADNTPWLIAGGAIVLLALVLLRRRGESR